MAFQQTYRRTLWVYALVSLFFVNCVMAYYCDNDKCGEEEYCCGDNTCCKSYKVWDLWYFWCGFLFFMFLLSLCTCLWRYRLLSGNSIFINNYPYAPLQQVDTGPPLQFSVDNNRYKTGSHQPYGPPVGAPPPYKQILTPNVKMATPPPTYAQVVGVRESH